MVAHTTKVARRDLGVQRLGKRISNKGFSLPTDSWRGGHNSQELKERDSQNAYWRMRYALGMCLFSTQRQLECRTVCALRYSLSIVFRWRGKVLVFNFPRNKQPTSSSELQNCERITDND